MPAVTTVVTPVDTGPATRATRMVMVVATHTGRGQVAHRPVAHCQVRRPRTAPDAQPRLVEAAVTAAAGVAPVAVAARAGAGAIAAAADPVPRVI